MFRTRIAAWGLDKNYKKQERQHMLSLMDDSERTGKEVPSLYIRGQPAQFARLQRYRRRKNKSTDRRYDAPSISSTHRWGSCVDTARDLNEELSFTAWKTGIMSKLTSPTPTSIDPPDLFRDLEHLLLQINAHYFDVHRGNWRDFYKVSQANPFGRDPTNDLLRPFYIAMSSVQAKDFGQARVQLGLVSAQIAGALHTKHLRLAPILALIICSADESIDIGFCREVKKHVLKLTHIMLGPNHPLSVISRILFHSDAKYEILSRSSELTLGLKRNLFGFGSGENQASDQYLLRIFLAVKRTNRYDEAEFLLRQWLESRGRFELTQLQQEADYDQQRKVARDIGLKYVDAWIQLAQGDLSAAEATLKFLLSMIPPSSQEELNSAGIHGGCQPNLGSLQSTLTLPSDLPILLETRVRVLARLAWIAHCQGRNHDSESYWQQTAQARRKMEATGTPIPDTLIRDLERSMQALELHDVRRQVKVN